MQSKKIKITIIVLAVLFAVSLMALAGTLIIKYISQEEATSVEVPGNIITPDGEGNSDTDKDKSPDGNNTTDPNGMNTSDSSVSPGPGTTEASTASGTKAKAIVLHNRKPEDNTLFQVPNMFPGDKETKYYRIKGYYKGDIVVRYHADIRNGYEKLAEVLKVKIRLPETNETLYDGLMRDMPKSLNYALHTNTSTQSELYYEITAYLDTSVGNDYMDKNLIADFRWWVEEIDNLDPPHTGDSSNLYLWGLLTIGSLLGLLLLIARRRKEETNEA